MIYVAGFFLWILFGFFSAVIANSRGRSAIGWFFVGFFFGPFGLLVTALPVIEFNEQVETVTVSKRGNEVLQWTGTLCFMAMYILMSLNMYPWNIVAGMMGSACYLAWTVRVANKPQMVVNIVGIAVCAGGLFKAFG